VLIHHAVGGKAGNEANARYGRGGGLAAEVGEQATVHQLMKDNGVQIFFYGHDHVFVDMTVDGIHYTEVGASGAPWKFTTAETGYTDYWSESGWARVDVSSASVRVSFLSDSGVALYDYTLE
jgi:predicted phosphodiesterase